MIGVASRWERRFPFDWMMAPGDARTGGSPSAQARGPGLNRHGESEGLMNLVSVNMAIFLVTSADSASFFVAMQMSRGAYEPTLRMKVIWGIFVGMPAVVLLVSGGLKSSAFSCSFQQGSCSLRGCEKSPSSPPGRSLRRRGRRNCVDTFAVA